MYDKRNSCSGSKLVALGFVLKDDDDENDNNDDEDVHTLHANCLRSVDLYEKAIFFSLL